MVGCVAPGCKSGYNGKLPVGVTCHLLPKEEEARKRWIQAIRRENWTPSASARICSLHFEEEDFVSERTDSNPNRSRGELQRRRLKPNVVPHIFPNCPSYLSKKNAPERSQESKSDFRNQRAREQAESRASDFLKSDKLTSFDDILSEKTKQFPSSWSIITYHHPEKVVFEAMAFTEDLKPYLTYSLTVFKSLQFSIVCSDVILPNDSVEHITQSGQIERHSDISNLLAHLRSCYEKNIKAEYSVTYFVKKLEDIAKNTESLNKEQEKKILFLTEQLSLAVTPMRARRYSSPLLWMAMTWHKSSPSLYRQIQSEDLLTLPCTSHLKRISSELNLETGLSDSTVAYLKERIKSLSEPERLIALLIDEASITHFRAVFEINTPMFKGNP